ncbi:LysM peptidoglycan-binding domain-containing protein [Planococcus halotolerans]|uniref:Peptidoglycan endopeptidase n=1 Tax=Planococcus halotolerans TaxID=2233542 RepID=A0A365KQP3_9BACL|nr:peptidoglycan endopeptidase [Planococcus halotolerans]QHJ69475.1 LysM peptidoglycan-binding domain-containing protein [Planococcus halotolerans]RAZ75425.1 peptidoglycan endopeptidase [Planococcus halotolerans]
MNKIAFSVIASGSLALLIGVADAEASSTYTIKSGDSLWKIASQHNVSVANLKTWNNLSSDAIFPNQVLKVAAAATGSSTTAPAPAPAPSQPVSNATSTYTVKSGDTLSKIASLHKTTVSKIQQLNKISGHLIYPGQKLMVSAAASAPAVTAPKPPVTAAPAPAPAPAAGTARTYKVVSGDTLTGIAYRNGISVTQLMNWNGLTSSMIRVGQVLKIENSTVAPSTTPVSNPAPPAATDTVGKIVETAKSLVGTPYVWGGSTASGFDCSGFIYYVYNQAGVKIPRTSTTGYDSRSYDISSPQVGDLVFFENTYRAGISHMGIYIGNNQFIHAGGDKVQITSLDNSYWSKHFAGYKRLYAMD